jgi:anthranilate synthase/aminodeoxychorismate synthase-like glutamine amidotransferase
VVTGASPEVLVRLDGGDVEVRPIAGTRRRGGNAEEDAALEAELRNDPKELAEHTMLIDLGRNDLGRVAAAGTVRLTERMVVERYSHVMHLTSNVRGRGVPGVRPADVVRAAFPAGTLSGAPKIRAMEIIEELETARRGIYGGAIGYVSYTGNMDLAIAIRTLVAKQDKIYVQAGAGIVADSVPRWSSRSASTRRARSSAPSRSPAGHRRREDRDVARDRQLRFLHLQPRSVSGRAAAGGARRPQRRDRRGRHRGLAPSHIVISPGPCTPNEAGISLDVIKAYAGKIPILGVCLGHQSIGQAFGGKIVRAARVMHGKTSMIHHDGKGVFAGLPNPFEATRYHSLLIEPASVPDALEVTAKTDEGEIMAVRHRTLPVEGVQFHPESFLTTAGKDLLANFIAKGGRP